jgi:hypothetical protein
MAVKSPLALVKETFGDKAKLVEALEKLTGEDLWMSRTNKNKGLAHVSNAKLLRLHAIFEAVKEKFGTREKLIDSIVDLEKRSKDTGLRQRLLGWPVPRLYDAYKSAAKRLGRAVRTTHATRAMPEAQPKKEAKAPAEKGKPSAKLANSAAAKKAAPKTKPAKTKAAAKKGAPKKRAGA